jgi:acyl carrier protein
MVKEFKEERLIEILAKVFEIDRTEVNENSSPDTIEKWDSLHHMSLIVALEETFQIELTEEQTLDILNYQLIKITLQEHGISFN